MVPRPATTMPEAAAQPDQKAQPEIIPQTWSVDWGRLN